MSTSKFSSGLILLVLLSWFSVWETQAKPTSNVVLDHRLDHPQQYFPDAVSPDPSDSVPMFGNLRKTKSLAIGKSRQKRSPYPPGFVMWSLDPYYEPCFCPTGTSKCRCHSSRYFGPGPDTPTTLVMKLKGDASISRRRRRT